MTFEQEVTTTTRIKVREGGERSWWHVYQMGADGMTATIVLKQGVPEPAKLTPELVLRLTGIEPDDGLHELFDGAEVRLLATFDREPSEDEVQALADPDGEDG